MKKIVTILLLAAIIVILVVVIDRDPATEVLVESGQENSEEVYKESGEKGGTADINIGVGE